MNWETFKKDWGVKDEDLMNAKFTGNALHKAFLAGQKSCMLKEDKLYHVTSERKLESIMKDGLKTNNEGSLYLTKDPSRWMKLHDDSVVLEVYMPNTSDYKEYQCNEFICKSKIPKKYVKTTGIFRKEIEKYLPKKLK